jgi:hypothetical protein
MFATTPIYQVGSSVVFGLRRESILPDPTDSVVQVTQAWEGRLDLLSYELYGTVDLWWAVAELNHLVDPFTEVVSGVQLRVPSRDRLLNLTQ